MLKKWMRFLICMVILGGVFLGMQPRAAYTAGVYIDIYPQNVIPAMPANDTLDSDGGPIYRESNTNAMNAPFVVVVRIVGYKDDDIRLWLTDTLGGDTVETYDRFASGADADLGGTWLAESGGSAPAGFQVTSNIFYAMVIGRMSGGSSNPTFTVNYQVDSGSGYGSTQTVTAPAASTLLSDTDWYLNWDDSGAPGDESGDPITADYVELFDEAGTSVSTAPIDVDGYFEAVLPDGADGEEYLAEARSEGGSVQRGWVTTISETTGSYGELLNAGTGEPTVVTLAALTASSNVWLPVGMVVGVSSLALGALLFIRKRR